MIVVGKCLFIAIAPHISSGITAYFPLKRTSSISSFFVPYWIPAYLVFSKKFCFSNSSSGIYLCLLLFFVQYVLGFSNFSILHIFSASWVFPDPDGPTRAITDGFIVFLFLYNDALIICSTRYTNSVILFTDKRPVIFLFHGFLMSTGYVAGVSSTL